MKYKKILNLCVLTVTLTSIQELKAQVVSDSTIKQQYHLTQAQINTADTVLNVMFDMTLEDLMDVKIVSASKKSESIRDAASNITIITDQMIKDWGVRDLKDVVSRVAGYQVVTDRDEMVFGARGNVADNNQKYLMLLDGQRVYSTTNFGSGNFIEQPNNLSNVKRIEIIKGPGSVVWGSDALAGVINVITYSIDDLPKKANVTVAGGTDGFGSADFQVGHKVAENADIMVSGSYTQSDGQSVGQDASTGFPILSTKYTTPGAPSGRFYTQMNRQYPSYMLHVKARVGAIKVAGFTMHNSMFNRAYEYNFGRNAAIDNTRSFVEGMYDKDFSGWKFTARVAVFNNKAEYVPIRRGSGNKNMTYINFSDQGVNTTADLNKDFSDKLALTAGIGYVMTKYGPSPRINNYNPDSANSAQGGKYNPNTEALFVDQIAYDNQFGSHAVITYKPATYLSFIGGGRFDYNDRRGNDKGQFNPRLGIISNPTKSTTIKALYNRGFLRPSNTQTSGAKSIKSETMDQFDFIVIQKFGPLNVTLNAYYQQLNNLILIIPSLGGFVNTGNYSSKGLEVDLNSTVLKNHSIWANASFCKAEGSGFDPALAYDLRRVDLSGQQLSFPSFNTNAGFTVRLLENKLFFSPAVRYVAPVKYRQYAVTDPAKDVEANYAKTPNFIYADLNIGYEMNKKVGFYLATYNVFDERRATNQSVWNGTVGQYGRQIIGRVKFHF